MEREDRKRNVRRKLTYFLSGKDFRFPSFDTTKTVIDAEKKKKERKKKIKEKEEERKKT